MAETPPHRGKKIPRPRLALTSPSHHADNPIVRHSLDIPLLFVSTQRMPASTVVKVRPLKKLKDMAG